MPETPEDRARRRLSRTPRPGAIVAALAFSGLVGSFTMTIMLPIQAELPDLVGASRDDTAWVITVTLLVGTVVTPISGKLGDMYGKRRIVLALLVIQALGGVIAAVSTDVVPLIIGRGLQGVGMGVIPLGIAILRDTMHRDRLGPSIGFMSATLGIGGAIGLPLSGIVTQYLEWHVLFWIAAAIAAIAFGLVVWLVPVSTLRSPGRLDVIGAIGMMAGLVCILLAVTRGNEWGWASPLTLGLFIGGAVILAAWGWYELRLENPIADLRVAVRPSVLLTNLASIMLGFSLFAGNIAYPQLLELPAETGVGLGLSLMGASLVLLPHALAIVVVSPVAGRLMGVIGPKPLLVAASALVGACYVLTLLAPATVWAVLVANVLLGIGIGVGYAAMPTLIMQSVPATETGAANGVNTLMRSLGTATAAAVVGAILANSSFDFEGTPVPTAEAFHLAFLIGLGGAIVAIGVSLAIPRPRALAGEHEALPEGSL